MSDKYFSINIRVYLDKEAPTYIGEENLYDLLSDFSCPKNPDVEHFLLHNAIEFTKKDQSIQSYTTAAYLIAQLGKNYALPREKQIPGNILLGFALESISKLKYSVGGVMEFLECEDNEFLLNFYIQNHFNPFNTRVTNSYNNKPHTLHQLLKFI